MALLHAHAERNSPTITAQRNSNPARYIFFPPLLTRVKPPIGKSAARYQPESCASPRRTNPRALRCREYIDQAEAGRVTAEWLVNELNGQGNLVVITDVPGT